MTRKALFFITVAAGLAWSVTAVAGEDLAYVAEGNRPVIVVGLGHTQSVSVVDLDEQRGAGASVPMPSTRIPTTGPVAVILWDEVSKGRTQNSGTNIGVGIQGTNVRN